MPNPNESPGLRSEKPENPQPLTVRRELASYLFLSLGIFGAIIGVMVTWLVIEFPEPNKEFKGVPPIAGALAILMFVVSWRIRTHVPPPTRTRHKLRFGLRALFVLTTLPALPAGWVGWQVSAIREREAVSQWVLQSSQPPNLTPDSSWDMTEYWFLDGRNQKSGWRRFLGEDSVPVKIRYPSTAAASDVQRVKAAFPEVDVQQWREEEFP